MTGGGRTAVVVGAGVVGAAIGLELARRGWSTTIVDRGAGPGHGSTAASSAVVRFTYSTVAGTAMAYEAAAWWSAWAEHVDLPPGAALTSFVQCGVLMFEDPSGIASTAVNVLDIVGVPYEWWTIGDLERRMPHLATGSWYPPTAVTDERFGVAATARLGGALYTPEGGYVTDPQLAAQNLADAAVAAGAELRFRAEVTSVDHRDGRVRGVLLDSGEFLAADVVVNAAGPHSAEVNRRAGALDDMSVRTMPLRQQVAHVRVPDELEHLTVRHPAIADLDSGIYVRPDHRAFLVGGVEAPCDPLTWLDDPDDLDLELDGDEWEAHVMRLARRVPDLGVPHERRGVVGVYDVSDDWMPILDRSSIDGYFMAVGTSGNQFKNAPVIGHCMVELIEAVGAGLDHDREPLVVRGPRRGLSIDLGTFSRRRSVAADQLGRGVLG